jgi:tetratricopeptide (TPR) repeat protein
MKLLYLRPEIQEAEEAFLEGLRRSPKDAELNFEYGEFLSEHPERREEALKHLERTVELAPRWAYAHWFYRRAGHRRGFVSRPFRRSSASGSTRPS